MLVVKVLRQTAYMPIKLKVQQINMNTDHAATESSTKSGPLNGMKVLDLSHVMAGPACTRMLADMGADVIKIEKVGGGDDTRRMLPPDIAGESVAFMMMNRNKRGIVLDLKQERGVAVFKRLLATSDVLIENYRADTMARLGLGYDQLTAEFPGLIYCAISGYGRTGPMADHGGFDLIAQGMSGLMSVTGPAPDDSDDEQPPVKVGPPACDITAGILAANGGVRGVRP